MSGAQIARLRIENLLTHILSALFPYRTRVKLYRPRPGRPAMSPRQLTWAGLQHTITHDSFTDILRTFLTLIYTVTIRYVPHTVST